MYLETYGCSTWPDIPYLGQEDLLHCKQFKLGVAVGRSESHSDCFGH